MYGTVAQLRVKSGEGEAVIELMNDWNHDRRSNAAGFNGGYVFRSESDPEHMILVAAFDDQQTYRANADNPEQDRWFRRVREHLRDDPLWEDGEIVSTF